MTNFELLLNYARLKLPDVVPHLEAEGKTLLHMILIEELADFSSSPYVLLNEVISYPSSVSRKEWHSFVESTINLTWEDLK